MQAEAMWGLIIALGTLALAIGGACYIKPPAPVDPVKIRP